MISPSRATIAGRTYLDLRRVARQDRRPVDELMQLYVLESFLSRLARTGFADRLVLKGGVLLAAFGERRPTRDIDLQALGLDNNPEAVRAEIVEIAAVDLDDGVSFDLASATTQVIRDEDAYSGARVTMTARLASARPNLHVDVSIGDPIKPAPQHVRLPRILGGEVVVRGYPLAMVHSEKIVTAIARGTVNTRWRDFADVYVLSRRHEINGTDLAKSIKDVAMYRRVTLVPLDRVLAGYGVIGQQRWAAWRRKHRLDDRLPEQFGEVVVAVACFADPAIAGTAAGQSWDPSTGTWSPAHASAT
ncbi:MAG TPA: nucleotidyl transferase AbiEii/AbiGii toxin family protein [Streptosporangiaceae bacterium]|nr:nucleotidyl transferase AbiEii/AbiGii toxin family protein [Streptosporangiaceae bacterium]